MTTLISLLAHVDSTGQIRRALIEKGYAEYQWEFQDGSLICDSDLDDWRKPPVGSRFKRIVLSPAGKLAMAEYRSRFKGNRPASLSEGR